MHPHSKRPEQGQPPTWRGNFSSACAIDLCLAIQASHGTYCAAAVLRAHGLDVGVAIRVLVRHVHRRAPPTGIHSLRTYFSPPPLIYSHTHY
ncbi:hypothetical protein [Janthinobacterium fluminis]|uniref:Uncharacterized protein n=1 Tax=Janthinobacterium fluminis TaxID=2987524 RepID=A0ABT5K018_9BURK|nr:hypothetical protein [Janthinobacterium fluminis]MDC8758318.1 hypothetical protein [Janthinobacterium fluminis]